MNSRLVSDTEAVKACYQFAEDHRIIVEHSCSAGLAAVYEGYEQRLVAVEYTNLWCSKLKDLDLSKGLVIVVCGGSVVNFELLEAWLKQFNIRK